MTKTDIKQIKQKELFVEQLRKTPIIQIVCEKLEIGRTTFYRWRRQDKKFAGECDKAISEGNYLVSDLAESQLISAIKDKNLTAIIFWLKTHNPKYSSKLELSGNLGIKKDELTREQEKSILKALKLASLVVNEKGDNNEKPKKQSKRN